MDDEELWRAIEAAGPLDWVDPLSDPAPPGIDVDAWSERLLTQADRRRTFFARFAWAVPSREAITRIRTVVGRRRLIEICAGCGLWARLLSSAGLVVLATDAGESSGAEFFPVECMDAEAAVRSHPECEALLVCWPPLKSDCAFRALRAFRGDMAIYAGDVRFTGDQQLHEILRRDWILRECLRIPSWPGLDDRVYLYQRDYSTSWPRSPSG